MSINKYRGYFIICYAALMALLLLGRSVTANAQDQTYAFDIPAQELGAALRAFASTSRQQVTFEDKVVQGKRNVPLKGTFTARDALEQLLDGSGLSARKGRSGLFIVRPDSAAAVAGEGMRLVQMNTDGDDQGKGRATGPKEESAQVVVEGQRDRPLPFTTANLDLTRTENDALPFTVFTARDIELSGMANLSDFLQNRLPQNFSNLLPQELEATGVTPQNSRIDMRGWGVGETVVLLNGRRMSSQYAVGVTDTGNATPYLQGIPLGSIERIEILSSAASAIYGANATGGVVNIITRQDFHGGQLGVNYETPADTHAPRREVNLSYGMALKWGWGLRVNAGYSDTEPMRIADRADVTVTRWRQRAMQFAPTALINSTNNNPALTSSIILGATPNIRTPNTTTDLFPSIAGLQNFTTVPTGSTGNTPRSAYQPGVYNIELAEGSAGNSFWGEDSTIGTWNNNTAVSLGLDRNFGPQWRWSLDYNYYQSDSVGTQGGLLSFNGSSSALTPSRPAVPANAPTNPFGQLVWLALIDPNLVRPEFDQRPTNVTWSMSSTLRGAFGEWRGYFDMSFTQNRNVYFQNTYQEPAGGWTAAFMSGRYNPFVDPRVVSPAAPEFYEDYIMRHMSLFSASRTYQTGIKLSGPLFRLPAGAVELTGGVEGQRMDRYRSDQIGNFIDAQTGAPRIPTGFTTDIYSGFSDNANTRFRFDNYAAYAEANIPLLSAAQGIPLARTLELFSSGRIDRMARDGFRGQTAVEDDTDAPPVPATYDATSHLFVVGLRYEPVEGVILRATRSLGFKPPTVSQVAPPVSLPVNTITATDPVRNESVIVLPSMYMTGGNPDLLPESTNSVNFGIILSPPWIRGLRMSVDYVDSVRDDAIFAPTGVQEAIALSVDLPALVTRGAPNGHPSGVGPITFVDVRTLNLRQIASRSLDLSLRQQLGEMRGGQLVLSAAVTKNLSFKVQASNTGASVEQVRSAAAIVSRQIKWGGNAQLRWESPQWGIGWNAQYFDTIFFSPIAMYVAMQGSNQAPSRMLHDLNMSYRLPAQPNARGLHEVLSGTSFTFGVKNVFDNPPRFWATSIDRGVAPFDSLIGRSVWLQMKKDF